MMEEMNCLSVRRIVSTDIKQANAELKRHLHECNACKSFYRRQLEFSQKLKEAVEIDVPEGLGARILVEHKINQKLSQHRKYRWLAMAASLVLVVSVSMLVTFHSPPALASVIVEHVKEDADAFNTRDDISLAELNELLKPHGVRMDDSLGRVTHAGNCLINDMLSAHVVFAGKNAPVTLIIVPQKLDSDHVTIDDQEFKGKVMNTQRGALALLSQDQESLLEFESRLHDALMTFM